MKKVPEGSVHGRFQPPHLDHLKYILAAMQSCDHLIVGITQPDHDALDECRVDPHRAIPAENPLTYEERCACIRAMLDDEKIDQNRYSFVKFRIDKAEELTKTINTDTVCFTTICNSWNLEKIERLRSCGFLVEVLWDKRGQSVIEGTELRRRIRKNDETWRDLMHPACIKVLEDKKLIERIAAS